jgi:aminopeptidase-like protein
MKIHVYDTHVKTAHGQQLHFDVLVDDEHQPRVKEYAEKYLNNLGINNAQIVTSSCQFCHSEMANPEVQATIKTQGHYVLPLNV